MNRRSNDDADAEDEAAQDDAEGSVLVVLELFAEREGQHLHEHEPHQAEDDQAQGGEDGGDEELVQQLIREHHLPPWKMKTLPNLFIFNISFLGVADSERVFKPATSASLSCASRCPLVER